MFSVFYNPTTKLYHVNLHHPNGDEDILGKFHKALDAHNFIARKKREIDSNR